MSQLIEKNEALGKLQTMYIQIECACGDGNPVAKGVRKAYKAIERMPTIDPEVRYGRWIEETEPDENGNVIAMCNQCYHTDEHGVNIKIPYCWYCGARMDGGADNDD